MGEKNKKYKDYASYSSVELEKILKTSFELGLTSQEVNEKYKIHGDNIIKEHEQTILDLIFIQLKSPFIIAFICIGCISLLFGQYQNAFVIFLCIIINLIVGFYQEFKALVNFKKLKKYLISFVKVVRNGKEVIINSQKIVPGDIILLYPGDKIPADVRFIKIDNLTVDESVLTGEANPTNKSAESIKGKIIVFNAKNIGFAGTTIITGKATAVVIATGAETEFGFITYLSSMVQESTFAKGINTLSRFILYLIIVTIAIIFIANIFIKGHSQSIFSLFIFSTALAVTAIPEALPIIIVFALSHGAALLAKKKVIIKHLSALENLGSIDLLCVDKTGTLTENNLTVHDVYAEKKVAAALYALLGAEIDYEKIGSIRKGFDIALWHYVNDEQKQNVLRYKKIKEIPFDPIKRHNSTLVQDDNGHMELIARGMVDKILSLCPSLSENKIKDIYLWTEQEENKGNRVIAVAKKEIDNKDIHSLAQNSKDLQFVGLISFDDPIKKTAITAINKAKKIGLSLKIISGDSKQVCGTVAKKIGLIQNANAVLTGFELENMSAAEQQKAVEQYVVFARILPEQKYEIIKILKNKYEVGYLGDGINDAPALKIADVALVVQEAVDIAREMADIILLKKSLLIIIDGIEEGRKVIINVLKYIKTTLAANFGNFYALAFATLLINYLPMLPLHLLLLNFLSDFPMLAIATDNVDDYDLKKPQKYNPRNIILFSSILGITSTAFDLIYFAFFKQFAPIILQTGWFIESVLTEVVFMFSTRSKQLFWKMSKPSNVLIILSIITCSVTVGLPFTSFGQKTLKFASLSMSQLFLIFIIVIAYFITTEIMKKIYYYFVKA